VPNVEVAETLESGEVAAASSPRLPLRWRRVSRSLSQTRASSPRSNVEVAELPESDDDVSVQRPRLSSVFGPRAEPQQLGTAELDFISDLELMTAGDMSTLEVPSVPAPIRRRVPDIVI
jgi:hypothetical protein